MTDTILVPIGITVPTRYETEGVLFRMPFRPHTCAAVVAQPRYGKGGVAKPLVVRLSKERPVLVFDFKGEWSTHITQPNPASDDPDFVAEYKIYRDFTFKLEDFTLVQDWVSLGFDGYKARQLRDIFIESAAYHGGIPDRFMEVINNLPIREDDIVPFNERFGTKIQGAVNWAVATQEYRLNLPARLKWFWQGPHDKRPIYDFGREWLAHRNIFIDFNTGDWDMETMYRNQTFAGKILHKMREYYRKVQGVIVMEECDFILPYHRHGHESSSVAEVKFLAAKAPKYKMSLILLMQTVKQVDPMIFEVGAWVKLFGRFNQYPPSWPELRFEPDGNYREFLWRDINGRWKKFVPLEPCCMFESNLSGGMTQ